MKCVEFVTNVRRFLCEINCKDFVQNLMVFLHNPYRCDALRVGKYVLPVLIQHCLQYLYFHIFPYLMLIFHVGCIDTVIARHIRHVLEATSCTSAIRKPRRQIIMCTPFISYIIFHAYNYIIMYRL